MNYYTKVSREFFVVTYANSLEGFGSHFTGMKVHMTGSYESLGELI